MLNKIKYSEKNTISIPPTQWCSSFLVDKPFESGDLNFKFIIELIIHAGCFVNALCVSGYNKVG
jgi:hypothetical protein